MADYSVQVAGTYSLEEIEAAIRGEEAGASRFSGSQVAPEAGTPANRVSFTPLPPGSVPKTFYLRTGSQQAPGASTKIWSGTMVVGGTMVPVSAYRQG
jgi:hypothetical protein